MKKATEVNSQDSGVLVDCQNIWFGLHDGTLRRFTNTGYVNSRGSFLSTMVERKSRVIEALKTVKNMFGMHEFARLCNVSRWAVYSWLNKDGNVPLSALTYDVPESLECLQFFTFLYLSLGNRIL